jgi:hypothetical protein
MAAYTWNPADKSATVTLTGGSLIATTTSAAQAGVRGLTSVASGKVYVEHTIGVLSGFVVGWANAAQSLAGALGATADSFGYQVGGSFRIAGTFPGTVDTARLGQTVRIAWDITAKLVWIALDNQWWNSSKTADPATGVGGISTALLNAGPYFPMFGVAASGTQTISRFGATDNWFPNPAGFASLDTNAQVFEATAKFQGYGLLGPPRTAESVAKMLGYGLLGPPSNAASVAKMLGYAITTSQLPNFTRAQRLAYLRM